MQDQMDDPDESIAGTIQARTPRMKMLCRPQLPTIVTMTDTILLLLVAAGATIPVVLDFFLYFTPIVWTI